MTVTHLVKQHLKCQSSSSDYFPSVTWFRAGENNQEQQQHKKDSDSRSVPLLPGGAYKNRAPRSPTSRSLFSNFTCKSRFTTASHTTAASYISASKGRFATESTCVRAADRAEMGLGFKVLAAESNDSPASAAALVHNEEGLITPRIKSLREIKILRMKYNINLNIK